MRIPKEQLDLMAYKVHNIPEGKSIGDVYPEFKRYPAFDITIKHDGKKAHIDTEFVIRYVILMWAKDSPLWTIPDLPTRKDLACEIIKQRYKGLAAKAVIERLINDELEGVGEIELAFTMLSGGPLLSEYMTKYHLMYRIMADITSPIIPSDKMSEDKVSTTLKNRAANSKELTPLRLELDALAKELWPQKAEMRKQIDKHLQQTKTTQVGTRFVAEQYATSGSER